MDAVGFKSAYVLGFSMGRHDRTGAHSPLSGEGRESSPFARPTAAKAGPSSRAGVLKKLADRSGTPVEQVERFCSLFFCEEWLEIHGEDGEEFMNRYLESPAE